MVRSDVTSGSGGCFMGARKILTAKGAERAAKNAKVFSAALSAPFAVKSLPVLRSHRKLLDNAIVTKAKPETPRVRVGVDTGGTFTDFVFAHEGRVQIFKLASTPDDPSRAIIEGLRRIARDASVRIGALEVVHGTTVGTNALLERRGARAALVTTAGFEDVLEIG